MICDEKDNSVSITSIPNYQDFLSAISEKIPELVNATISMLKVENTYMYNRDEFNRKKKEIQQKRLDKKYNLLQKKADKINKQKSEFLNTKYNELKESNLFSNYDFILELVSFSHDMKEKYHDYYFNPDDDFVPRSDESLKKYGYMYIMDEYQSGGYSAYILCQVIGHYKRAIRTDENAFLKDMIGLNFENDNFVLVIISKSLKKVIWYCFGNFFEFKFLEGGFCAIRYNLSLSGESKILIMKLLNGERQYLSEITTKLVEEDFADYMTSYSTNKFLVCGLEPYKYDEEPVYMTLFTKKPFKAVGDFCTTKIDFENNDDSKLLLVSKEHGCYINLYYEFLKINYNFECKEDEVGIYFSTDLKSILMVGKGNDGALFSVDNLETPYATNLKMTKFIDVSDDPNNKDGHFCDMYYETSDGVEHILPLAD